VDTPWFDHCTAPMAETAKMADVEKDIENPLITQINHWSFM
jgi:hypothetical protein